jgi:hypothetical protein
MCLSKLTPGGRCRNKKNSNVTSTQHAVAFCAMMEIRTGATTRSCRPGASSVRHLNSVQLQCPTIYKAQPVQKNTKSIACVYLPLLYHPVKPSFKTWTLLTPSCVKSYAATRDLQHSPH